jgi:hypothetical protein
MKIELKVFMTSKREQCSNSTKAMRSSRFPDLPKSSRSQTTTPKGGLNFVSKEDQRRARNRQAQRNHRELSHVSFSFYRI